RAAHRSGLAPSPFSRGRFLDGSGNAEGNGGWRNRARAHPSRRSEGPDSRDRRGLARSVLAENQSALGTAALAIEFTAQNRVAGSTAVIVIPFRSPLFDPHTALF